jgi:RNA polymerase sigma factor (sigma-70 family)
MLPGAERTLWIARWVLPLEPALRQWLRARVTGSGLDVDDVVQETYAILGELATTDHILRPRNYVYQVAQSILLAQYRRSRIVPIDYLAELDRFDPAADAPGPDQQASGRQELERLAAMMAELPDRQREAFRLLKLEGLSQREAARRMQVSESTLEKHIAKALSTLMTRLGRGGKPEAGASSLRQKHELDARGAGGKRD